jgi:protein STE50
LQSSKPIATLSFIEPRESLRRRARENQKQKSVLAIARWTIRDGRRFEKRVRRLGELVDGLEDVARAVGLSPHSRVQLTHSVSADYDDIPPPYSLTARRHVGYQSLRIGSSGLENSSSRTVAINPSHPLDEITTLMRQQLLAMERYSISFPSSEVHPLPRARDKLLALSEHQFADLRVDVYEELLRRQEYELPTFQHLPEIRSFHPNRNQARKKLSTLIPLRFGQLVEDIVFELKRRYPPLQDIPTSDLLVNLRTPVTPQPVHHSRGTNTPPLPLQYRAPHRSTLVNRAIGAEPLRSDFDTSSSQSVITHCQETTSSQAQDRASDGGNYSPGIFDSFRAKMDDPCYKILPAALQKYHITAPWTDYSLYIIYSDEERCLEMDEKPLELFKMLEREGKGPCFMLRKAGPLVDLDD